MTNVFTVLLGFMKDDQFDKIAHIDFGTICRSLFVYLT